MVRGLRRLRLAPSGAVEVRDLHLQLWPYFVPLEAAYSTNSRPYGSGPSCLS